jgi:hypothetical protein
MLSPDDPGPSGNKTLLVDPVQSNQSAYSRIKGKEPHQDEIKEPEFNITNPCHRSDYLIAISEDNVN